MMKIHWLIGAMVALAVPAVAQEKGAVEFGGFGKYTRYDKSFSTSNDHENSFGAGGRLGVFVSPRFSFELDGSFNATDLENYFAGQGSSPVRYWPFHLRAIYHAPLANRWKFLLGAGPVLNHYGKSDNPVVKTIFGTDFGVGGLAGFRYQVTDWLSIRTDGTLDFMPSPRNGSAEVDAQGPSKNVHLGVQLGLSIHLNSKCTKRLDAIDLLPNTASVQTGQGVTFTVTGRRCDGSSAAPEVNFAVIPSGTVGPNRVFSSNTPGTFRVIARTLDGKLADTSTVTVTEPPPPPPPPPRLSRVELSPKTSTLKLGEPVSYTVSGNWSDGASRPMRFDECTLSADGNPSASGWTYSWSRSGDYGVTATCSGLTDRASASVRGLSASLLAMFGTNRYTAAAAFERMTLDQVAENMKTDQALRVYIDGHADWRNTVRYNAWLSQKRAEFIQRELVKRGADKSRMVIRAFGECKPVSDLGTEQGMARNRRVEVSQIETAVLEPAATCAESGPGGVSKIGRPGKE